MENARFFLRNITAVLFVSMIFAACSEYAEEPAKVLCQQSLAAVKIGDDFQGFPDGFLAERVFPEDSLFEQRHIEAGLDRWYFVRNEIGGTKALSPLSSIPGIDIIENVPEKEVNDIPFNDPLSFNQWHLSNDGSLYPGFVEGADIDVIPVWTDYTAGSKEVIVGVLDTGIYKQHPDISPILIGAGSDGSRSFLNSSFATPYDIKPQSNHGTHVAGIIAAVNNNGIGVCGIAGGDDGTGGVRIMDCQAIASGNSGDSGNIYAAMVWAADHGAVILNNSWNEKYDNEDDVPDSPSYLTSLAIEYFINNAGLDQDGNQTGPMKGGVVFFSAGNDGRQRCQPAMYEKVIAVGATGPAGEPSTYSNFGPWVDICAPGGDYKPFSNSHAQIFSTYGEASYGALQGTSMACPVVSGVAALIVSQYGGPGFTNQDLREKLLNGVNREISYNHTKEIGPMVDAYEAITWSNDSLIPQDGISAETAPATATIKWKVKSRNGKPYYGYKIVLSSVRDNLKGLDPFNIPADCTYQTVNTYYRNEGDEVSASFFNLEHNKTYHYTVIPYTKGHAYPTGNETGSFMITENHPPKIWTSSPDLIKLNHDESTRVIVYYSDPDGDSLTVSTEAGSSAAMWKDLQNGTLSLEIDASKEVAGSYAAVAKVDDGELSARLSITYTIRPNEPVIIVRLMEDRLIQSDNLSFDLDYYFSDPDGDTILYTVHSSDENVKATMNGSTIQLSSSGPSIATITVLACDSASPQVSQSFNIHMGAGTKVADIFPSVVTGALYIAGIRESSIHISIISSTGKEVFANDFNLSPFSSVNVNLRQLAPGRYTVVASSSTESIKKTIIKI